MLPAIPPIALTFWRWSLALAILLPFVARPLWQHRAAVRRWAEAVWADWADQHEFVRRWAEGGSE